MAGGAVERGYSLVAKTRPAPDFMLRPSGYSNETARTRLGWTTRIGLDAGRSALADSLHQQVVLVFVPVAVARPESYCSSMHFVEQRLSDNERARFVEEAHFSTEMQRRLAALAAAAGQPTPEPDSTDDQLSAILQVEEALGVRFTSDFRTYLLFVERYPSEGNVTMSWRDWGGLPPPLSLAQIVNETRDFRSSAEFDHQDETGDSDPGVSRTWFDRGWVAFAYQDGRALCVDLAPTASGREGQILEAQGARRQRLADSIFDLLDDAISDSNEELAGEASAVGRALVAIRAFTDDETPAQVPVAVFVEGGQQPIERGTTPLDLLLTPGRYSIRAEQHGAVKWREDIVVLHNGTATPSLIRFFF